MAKLRGVKRDTVKLDLSHEDWILVKKELTVGEERDISGRSIRGYSVDGKRVDIDSEKLSFSAAATYILGWSLQGLDGKPIFWPANEGVDVKLRVLRELDVETMREIDAALEKHRTPPAPATPDELEEAEKKGTSGGSGTAAPSQSAA